MLRDAHAEVDAAYFEMRERLNALIIVEGAAAYENFVKTLNAIIAKYNALVHARHGHAHKITATEASEADEQEQYDGSE